MSLSSALPRPALALLCLLALAACDPKDDDTARPDGGDDTGASSGDDTGTGTDTSLVDGDSDGFTPADGDCDDDDAAINPGAVEVCDGVDNNCDGRLDEGLLSTFYADTDRDGFGDPDAAVEACEAPTHHTADSGDCDDTSALIYPGAAEVCDTSGTDEDCDGLVNDDDDSVTNTTTFYADNDSDGFGDAEATVEACEQPAGHVDNDLDCNDHFADADDPSEGCWSGTWSGTYTFSFSAPDLGLSDSCSGAVSLSVDMDASPMIDSSITCTTSAVGTLTIGITGDIDGDGVITGDIDTGYFTTTWDGDITKDVLSGATSGSDASSGFRIDYSFRMSATL